MKQEQRQTGCRFGTFCVVVLAIIVLPLAYGVFMGSPDCF